MPANRSFCTNDSISTGRNVSIQQGNGTEAIDYYKEAIALDPDLMDWNIFSRVGYELLKQGKEEEAVQYFMKAIGKTPDNETDVNACRLVGNALLKKNKADKAIFYYNKVFLIMNKNKDLAKSRYDIK